MAAFYAVRPLVVLVYTAVEHDVEAWACLLENRGRGSAAEELCRELRAARYLLVPMLVLGVAFLSIVIWQRLGVWRREIVRENGVGRAGGADGGDTVQGKV